MAFTAGEISNIAASALDFYFAKGSLFEQGIQDKPLLAYLDGRKKTFPGGKGNISIGVRGKYGDGSGNDVLKGYTHNDTLVFYNPATNQRANYPWREVHLGISFSATELKIDGISVVDDGGDGKKTAEHSKRELTVLVNLLESKLSDMGEQYAKGLNAMLWKDGTADAKGFAGVASMVTADPSVGTVGGIDRAVVGNEWWRNRARTAAFGAKVTGTPALGVHGGDAVTSNVADGGALIAMLQKEYRQLTRYGGRPDKAFCGSDWLGALETELRANGNYSMTGFAGAQDVAVGAIKYMGTTFEYDPSLDDLTLSKRCYWLDTKNIKLFAMEDEWQKQMTPARPANQMMLYRSITSTGQLVATQLNSSLVIDIT